MRKKIEKLLEKLGYKYIRYGMPYHFSCWKHKEKINFLKSILPDELSIKILDCVMKAHKTRNYKNIQSVYDNRFEKEMTYLSGETSRFDSSQYFPDDLINLSQDEVFVDGGGFIGDTTLNFIEKTQNKFKKVHIFEPMQENFEKISHNINTGNTDPCKINVYNAGLSSSEKEVFFDQTGSSAAKIDKKGNVPAKLVSLDKYVPEEERKEITYIKLDVEGAELDALEGMRETISKYKPKLAICIYHKPTDLWKIPLFIHKLNPSYKLYIRQHHPVHETVCYAL
ncbi:MAG: FkbM family methyltransferase [Tannerella sp.]|jgi:FkbM family methyltransferase|nr:FkbM family methyltransferase [Tannerella sp.]